MKWFNWGLVVGIYVVRAFGT